MPYKCKFIDIEEYRKQNKQPESGDMWYADWYLHKDGTLVMQSAFSPEYKHDWLGKRAPIVIVLPNGHEWVPDMNFYDSVTGDWKEHGWTITGEGTTLTATPSINNINTIDHSKGYHGWLQNGILSDDIEGRKY